MADINIDPGHGGIDPGGGTNHLFLEKNMVLQISLEQKRIFERHGLKVSMTRTTDEYLDSVPRTNRVKASGAKYCISNHINNYSNSTASGAETIHSIYSSPTIATGILNALVNAGAKRRRVFSKQGKSGDYYYMHRMTGSVNTVIVEYGFASNPEDAQKIVRDWKKYAEAVARYYIENVFKKKYIPENTTTAKVDPPKEEDISLIQAKKLQEQIDKLTKEINDIKSLNLVVSNRAETDITKVSKWAAEEWIEAVLNGYFDGTNPGGHLTREQAAIVVNRIRKNFRGLIEEKIEEAINELVKQVRYNNLK